MQSNKSRNLKSVEAHFMTYVTANNLDRSGNVANLSHRNSKLRKSKICPFLVLQSWWGKRERVKGQDQYTSVEIRMSYLSDYEIGTLLSQLRGRSCEGSISPLPTLVLRELGQAFDCARPYSRHLKCKSMLPTH
ncbi:hypothetical protein L798_11322 [Zootermopsis nevadensis]|uniref:Uncharacterized protein n=1 Tax=Zootermopsis nevadensis TaxID=136037 RepID=A0A067QYL8_ZOONE|nr:hypothetical protein L798_11322 [Zootermopsis nevadensis]